MLRWSLSLGALAWAGCGDGGEVHTYRLELSYPATEGGPLQLHSIEDLP